MDKVPISLQCREVSITRNLWNALCRLRLADKPRTLWVDAICIDQCNTEERNQQVGVMRQIYQSAKKVLIWVGEEGDDSHLIFQHVERWKKYRDDFIAGRTTENDAFGEAHLNPPHYKGRTYDAFRKFCHRPWFFRTWVIQEKALSKEAIILCGQDAEEWSLLVRPASSNDGHVYVYDPLQGVDGSTHLRHLDKIGPNSAAKSLLQYSILCRATDPRDKVYGLLGLFDHPLIPVDYSLTVDVVYLRFSQVLIQEARNIHLLHLFGTQRHLQTLPSWVPDFSVSKPIGILPRMSGRAFNVPARRDFITTVAPQLRFSGSEITMRGCNLEKIYAMSEELAADAANVPGSAPFTKTLHKWESVATQLRQKRFSHSIPAAFLRTLIAEDNYWNSGRHDDSGYLPHYFTWYDLFGAGVLRSFDEVYFREVDVILQWWGGVYQEDCEDGDVRSYTRNMKSACYGRSFYITDKGSMGLAPPQAKAGDSIVFFPGGMYPFVLRPYSNGAYSMVGDCYLYEFDEYSFTKAEVESFEEFVLR
jgi:hypothetical protein